MKFHIVAKLDNVLSKKSFQKWNYGVISLPTSYGKLNNVIFASLPEILISRRPLSEDMAGQGSTQGKTHFIHVQKQKIHNGKQCLLLRVYVLFPEMPVFDFVFIFTSIYYYFHFWLHFMRIFFSFKHLLCRIA